MNDSDSLQIFDDLCRSSYRDIRSEFLMSGIDRHGVAKSRALLYDDGTTIWVDKAAYYPTGVALGCPLPDSVFSQQLFAAASLFATKINSLISSDKSSFSLVPKESYHVTIVNFSHFDCAYHKKDIVTLDSLSFAQVRAYFRDVLFPVPRIHFQGLLLTRSGRLIVPGYATNFTAFMVRSELADLVPQFRTNLPKTLHIKLGHVLGTLPPFSEQRCQDVVDGLGGGISADISFKDIFTPMEILQGVFM